MFLKYKFKLMKNIKCPNCGEKLKHILNEWICSECEYHSEKPREKVEKSFR